MLNSPRRLRSEIQQRLQGTAGLVAHTGLQPVSKADKRYDGGSLHEIKMPPCPVQQSPSAVTKRSRRTKRHKRVHVRFTGFELPPRTHIKLRTAKNLHNARE